MEGTIYTLMIILAVLGSLFLVGGIVALVVRKKIAEDKRKKFSVLSVVITVLGLLAVLLPIAYAVYLQFDIEATAYDYESSLEGLVQAGDYDGAKELLSKGADPSASYLPDEGNPPIICAAVNGDQKMIKLLLDYGANVDQEDQKGYTAVFYAAIDHDGVDVLKFLIENGADVKHTSNTGETAAHLAAAAANLDAVKLLRENGADLKVVTTSGYSVIYYACTPISNLPSYDLLKYLVEDGADLTFKDSAGNDLAQILEENHTNYISVHGGDEDFDNDEQNNVYNKAIKYMRAKVDAAFKSASHKK